MYIVHANSLVIQSPIPYFLFVLDITDTHPRFLRHLYLTVEYNCISITLYYEDIQNIDQLSASNLFRVGSIFY